MTLLFTPVAVFAQTSDLDDVFEEYAGEKGYQTIIYGKKMISMLQENASNDVRKLLGGIEMIRIISYKGGSGDLRSDVLDEIEDDYELISRMDMNGVSSRFYLYDTGSKSDSMSFVMINSSPESCVILEIIGKFDVKDISKLSVIGQGR